MVVVNNGFQSLAVYVGVNLGGAYGSVAQKELHYAHVSAPLQKVRGKRVPQYMGRKLLGYSRDRGIFFYHVPEVLPAHFFTVGGKEHKVASLCPRPCASRV